MKEQDNREDKFTYDTEDIKSMKVYSSKEEVEQEDEKNGKKTVWYE